MQLTVTIPDTLAAEVEARGETPRGFVEGLIEGIVRTSCHPRKPRNMDKFFRDMAVNSDKLPQLPDDAFTRESFYQDHD